jgi:hypothetical protein
MLEQLIGKLNTREVMQTIVARFSPLPNTLEDKYVQHKTWQVGPVWTTVLKHDKTETFLIVEKTECGIIRVASDAGENHSEMMAIGLKQLESEMPVVAVKKKRVRKTVAERKTEKAAKAQAMLDMGGVAVKPARKPRTSKKAKE